MSERANHKAMLKFTAAVAEIVARYSIEEMMQLRSHAMQNFRFVVPFLEAAIDIAKMGAMDLLVEIEDSELQLKVSSRGARSPHLFDLLRSKGLFDTNADLADFAQRLFRGLASKRYDKMSRGEIAVHIVEYIEAQPSLVRRKLETTLRRALKARRFKQAGTDESFFSEWEKIIRNMGR